MSFKLAERVHVVPDSKLRAYLSHAFAYYGMRIVEHELYKIVRNLLNVDQDKYIAFLSFAGISATESTAIASSIELQVGESEKAVNWDVTPLAQLIDKLVKLGILRRLGLIRGKVRYYFTVDMLVFYCSNYVQHPEFGWRMMCETCTNCISGVETRELKIRDIKTGQVKEVKKEIIKVVYNSYQCPGLDVALFEVKTSVVEPYRLDGEEQEKLVKYTKLGLRTYYINVQIESLKGDAILEVYRCET